MGVTTTIGWTTSTWNAIRGCRRVSPGCENCYAERQAARFSGPGMAYEGLVKLTKKGGPRWSGKAMFVQEHLMDPFRWTKPRRIFTDSMSDLFYEEIPFSWIDDIVAVMMICCLHESRGGHVFQTLTKRPDRMRKYFADEGTQERVARGAGRLMEDGDGWFDAIAFRKEGLIHPNLWWGVSVENQDAADERIPELLDMPAAVRFLSCEPLLGPVDLFAFLKGNIRDQCLPKLGATTPVPGLDWVIAGCESGPGARPCDVEWLRSLRDQCAGAVGVGRGAGIPFFLKQAVEQAVERGKSNDAIVSGPGSHRKYGGKSGGVIESPYLDGKQWTQFPLVSA